MTANEKNKKAYYYQEQRNGRGTVPRYKGGWKGKQKEEWMEWFEKGIVANDDRK